LCPGAIKTSQIPGTSPADRVLPGYYRILFLCGRPDTFSQQTNASLSFNEPGVPPGNIPPLPPPDIPVPDPAPPPLEDPGDVPLPPITDPDVIEPGEPNPAHPPMRVRGVKRSPGDPAVSTVNSIQLAYSRESGDACAYGSFTARASTCMSAAQSSSR
jgi:hypothetical protein